MADMRTVAKVPGAREQGWSSRGDTPQGEGGRTQIADGVVAKIAAVAAREIGGVYAMGGGANRTVGAVRDAVTGNGEGRAASKGVLVEVGERQAAVDIHLVIEYGAAIQDLAAAVRRNVTAAVERMTGLEVTEINIRVEDVHLPDEGREDEYDPAPRVR